MRHEHKDIIFASYPDLIDHLRAAHGMGDRSAVSFTGGNMETWANWHREQHLGKQTTPEVTCPTCSQPAEVRSTCRDLFHLFGVPVTEDPNIPYGTAYAKPVAVSLPVVPRSSLGKASHEGHDESECDVPCGPVGSNGEKAVQRWADAAQYRSEPMPDGGKMTVTLLMATPDPLGVIAALCGMYVGRVARSLGEVTDEQRRQAFADMLETELDGPLSSVQFLFLVEGVDRAFTHQAVRQQFAFFAQESMRFAVKEGLSDEIPLPPSLAALPEDDPLVRVWRKALIGAEDAYEALVHGGMPAEEARGVAPHATTTRYYWSVNLKGLLIEAGKRTCTQAQFHWRQMFSLVAKALREYGHRDVYVEDHNGDLDTRVNNDGWQYELIADQLRPHCYQTGSCGFMAKFDRGCSIRERVELNAKAGRPSSEWHLQSATGPDGEVTILPILPHEWAADPGAART